MRCYYFAAQHAQRRCDMIGNRCIAIHWQSNTATVMNINHPCDEKAIALIAII